MWRGIIRAGFRNLAPEKFLAGRRSAGGSGTEAFSSSCRQIYRIEAELNRGTKKITSLGLCCGPSRRNYSASAGLIATAGGSDDRNTRPYQSRTMTRMHRLAHAAGMRLGCRGHGGWADVSRERDQQQKPGDQTMHSAFQGE
jgi:hypothetical protein